MTSLPARKIQPETDTRLAIPVSPFSEKSLASLRRAVGTVNGKPTLMGGFSLMTEDRINLAAKLSIFRSQLTAGAGDEALIAMELAALFSAFPMQDASASAGLRVAAYREAIGDAPAWALHEARRRVLRGDVASLDQRFCPTPPQLASVVREVMRWLRSDLADLEAIIAAGSGEPDAAQRERVSKGLGDLADSIRRGLAPQP